MWKWSNMTMFYRTFQFTIMVDNRANPNNMYYWSNNALNIVNLLFVNFLQSGNSYIKQYESNQPRVII